MKIIGITGGIGAGKSTVLSTLEQKYNAYILEADKVAHVVMNPGQPAYEKIVQTFPARILNEDRTINRSLMSELVFHDSEMLEQLNHIVHPAVKVYIQNEILRCRKEETISYFVVEAALLIEDGYSAICDEIWYVYAPVEQRIQRLMESRGYSYEKCLNVIQNQASEDFFRKNTQHVIDNSGSLSYTEKQIEVLLKND